MRILFLARHFGVLRNYERVILTLATRGHHLHLAAIKEDTLGGPRLVERLAADHPNISFSMAPNREGKPAFAALTQVRYAFDYLRYQRVEYADAPRLRLRARERTPRGVVQFTEGWFGRTKVGLAAARSFLHHLEASFPADPDVEQWVRAQAPDVMLFTPLISLGSSELDFLASARRLGVFTGFCVWSWDNLSSKALVRTMPDVTFVWNEVQRREAERLHGVPPERVAVTGAQNFDHWFERAPSRSRADFCARVGLPDDQPYLLWVCSALFRGGDPEAPFVRRWIEAVRNSTDVRLRETAILVRPHPSRLKEWQDVSLADLPRVAFWGSNPIDAESQSDYFESLYYSSAVVGLNTSAFLEAAIVGKAVYAILLPEFYEHQEGTLHFPYLLEIEGGLLHASRTLDDHIGQLTEHVAGAPKADRSARFVRTFLRPHGLDRSASDVFVAELERRVGQPPPPEHRSILRPVMQPVIRWLIRRVEAQDAEDWLLSEKQAWIVDKRRRRDEERRAQRRKARTHCADIRAAREAESDD